MIRINRTIRMDNYKEPRTERRKKSDKAKEKYERTGGLSQKHVRVAAAATKNSKNK